MLVFFGFTLCIVIDTSKTLFECIVGDKHVQCILIQVFWTKCHVLLFHRLELQRFICQLKKLAFWHRTCISSTLYFYDGKKRNNTKALTPRKSMSWEQATMAGPNHPFKVLDRTPSLCIIKILKIIKNTNS